MVRSPNDVVRSPSDAIRSPSDIMPSFSDVVRSSSDLARIVEPKVCVVSPRREVVAPSSTPAAPSEKFMTVFETMLTNPIGRFKSDKKLGMDSPAIDESAFKTTVELPSAYKPGRSAASSFRSSPPKHEYSQIADKLTHRNASDQTRINEPRYDIVTSNTTSTHTAFRLVNLGDPSVPPKLQKYLVQTQVSTKSTLISENNEVPPPTSSGETPKEEDLSLASKSPDSIFKKLGALNIKDDRAEFV